MKFDALTLINEKLNPLKKEVENLINLIKKYDQIAIFRHIHPDYDALGSQFGLKEIILDNFSKKTVYALGDNHPTFSGRIFPKTDSLKEEAFKENEILGIILDTANSERVSDQRYSLCKETIRIDHHLLSKHYATYNIEGTTFVAASEIIAAIFINDKKFNINKKAAEYLFMGIVGDSGRFVYPNTSPMTFGIGGALLSCGIELQDLYENMYLKEIKQLNVEKYILNNYVISPKGVAYYILNNDKLNEFGIEVQEAKNNVNIFSNYDGIEIWCSITEDVSEPCYRVSMRSKKIDIREVAAKYHGGGHKLACGAKIDSISEIKNFIDDLESLIK